MSLISQAILIVVKHMLLGRTWAEEQILMQPIDPIVGMLRPGPENGKPVIAVYADRAAGKPTSLETQGGPQSVDLKVYVYVPPSRFELPDGVAFEIDNTGAGLALNLIGRQVDAAFHFGDPDWLAVFRRFVTRVEGKVVGYVLVEVENSVRIPCMEIAYDLITVAEADFGKPIYGAWAELDVLLRKTDEGRHLADMIKSMIETPSGLLPYQQFQVNFGMTDAAIRAVGLGTITDDGSTPLLTDVELVPPVPPRMP